jgi:DnaJ-class molecular chaperone
MGPRGSSNSVTYLVASLSEPNSRVNEALQVSKGIVSKLGDIKSILEQVQSAETTLEKARANKNPSRRALNFLEMGDARGIALRLKLHAYLKNKKNQLQMNKSKLRQELEILDKISVCHYCGGSGEMLSHGYERFGRKIHSTISSDSCEHCGGSGRVELGEEVERIVERSKKQASEYLEESTL